ncbi:unnamed protein product, partial [Coccothraustes coccothraustes]
VLHSHSGINSHCLTASSYLNVYGILSKGQFGNNLCFTISLDEAISHLLFSSAALASFLPF